MLENFRQPGKASFILGGQWGSEGKGGSAALVAQVLARRGETFDIYTTNAGAQAGHTSLHMGHKRVVFHLPTAPLIAAHEPLSGNGNCSQPFSIYLNAGSIIDPVVLEQELRDVAQNADFDIKRFKIHPNAAVIEQQDRDAEGAADSAQTKIASTRKGVGNAQARKILRSAKLAKDHLYLKHFIGIRDLNEDMARGLSVLVEIPQGIGLSLNGPFYPHVTSRDCSIMQAMNDAGIHPHYYGKTMLVLRTFPIRVGNVGENSSGRAYADQWETSWDALGVPPEITTVTKRVRRVFEFSVTQAEHAIRVTRPDVIHLTFCDYPTAFPDLLTVDLLRICQRVGIPVPQFVYQWGPSTDDASISPFREHAPL